MPPELRTLIVDDEALARDVLKGYVNRVPSLQLVAECGDAIAALEVLRRGEVDLLLLDVQMPELSGLELLDTLNKPPATILTTAHSDYALDGFDYGVVDYLLKPVNFARFLKAVQRVPGLPRERTEAPDPPPDFLEIKHDGTPLLLPLAQLEYVKSFGNYLRLITAEKTYTTLGTLTATEERLPNTFQRVHKSYLVNLAHCTKMTANNRLGVGAREVPVSPLYKLLLLERLKENGG